jgi:hypothetical protein
MTEEFVPFTFRISDLPWDDSVKMFLFNTLYYDQKVIKDCPSFSPLLLEFCQKIESYKGQLKTKENFESIYYLLLGRILNKAKNKEEDLQKKCWNVGILYNFYYYLNNYIRLWMANTLFLQVETSTCY